MSTARLTTLARQIAVVDPSDNEVVIVGYARTAIGSFGGGLSSLTAVELGTAAVVESLKRTKLDTSEVDALILGHVLQSGVGQNPAKQVGLSAQLDKLKTCFTVNKVCASGMKAIELGALEIATGKRSIVVAGGMESMSRVPYLARSVRFGGRRMGDDTLVDGLILDGLWDVQTQQHMGNCAENTAAKFGITREEQDAYAARSVRRAKQAAEKLRMEIVPVKGVDMDEQLKKAQPEKLGSLKTAFKKEKGTVTAGNGSSLSDGAAVVVMMSRAQAKRRNMEILASIIAFEDAERDPVDFTIAPALAVERLMQRTRKSVADISRWEINEAFSVVAIANAKLLGIPEDRLNINGGAVALGHPLAASGARIVGALISQLEAGQMGCAAICNGGGGASAVLIKRE
jgi:acetyl-CoA C-acetyltransferase